MLAAIATTALLAGMQLVFFPVSAPTKDPFAPDARWNHGTIVEEYARRAPAAEAAASAAGLVALAVAPRAIVACAGILALHAVRQGVPNSFRA